MKSFPDKFPIRYAIIVNKLDSEDEYNWTSSFQKSLWMLLIESLEQSALRETKNLLIGFESIKIEDVGGNFLGELPMIKNPLDKSSWATDNSLELSKKFNDFLFLPNFHLSHSLKLFSYKGMLETPLFWKAIKDNDIEKAKNIKPINKLNFLNFQDDIDLINMKYHMIQSGRNLWSAYKGRGGGTQDVFYIDVPYSKLWKALDCGHGSGFSMSSSDKKSVLPDIKTTEADPEKIHVAIATSIDSLINEEMLALYKISKLCNCCNKPLPFDRKGRYCPDIPANIECRRKRNRQRQYKTHKLGG